MKLSQTRAAKLPDGRHHDGLGLYLLVRGENRSWEFRYDRFGKAHWMGLGRFVDVSLEDARNAARAARNKIREGFDPIAERAAIRAENSKASAGQKLFRYAADEYVKSNATEWSEDHKADTLKRLELYAFPTLGSLPVRSIDKAIIIDALRPIWETKHATARMVLGLVSKVLDYSKASGWTVGDNPASLIHHALPRLKTKAKNRPALPYGELYAFMKKLSAVEGIAARALEFAILTATRTDETRLAVWDEIDFENKRWNIPADRMKMGKPHSVPLAPRALELLKSLPKEGAFIFMGSKAGEPLGDKALLNTVQSIRPDVTTHGFRSTFRTWAGETTSFARDVLEMALAHDENGETEKAYARVDLFAKRVPLMTAWERFCYSSPAKGATVTPIRAA
jgi:integrase